MNKNRRHWTVERYDGSGPEDRWTTYYSHPDELDQNGAAASIDGGQFSTHEAAMSATWAGISDMQRDNTR